MFPIIPFSPHILSNALKHSNRFQKRLDTPDHPCSARDRGVDDPLLHAAVARGVRQGRELRAAVHVVPRGQRQRARGLTGGPSREMVVPTHAKANFKGIGKFAGGAISFTRAE